MIGSNDVWIAFGLTMVAGLSTGIGSAVALFIRRPNRGVLSFALGLSAGVMTYVSFMELMPEAVNILSDYYSEQRAQVYMLLAFFAGIALIALIDRLIPDEQNPHEVHEDDEYDDNAATPSSTSPTFTRTEPVRPSSPSKKSLPSATHLKRAGMMTAIAIAIHNFPEGLATFASALIDLDVALPIMIAIAIHNIPEGIAVSIPIYHATGSRKRAFWLSFASGMAEPLGAVVGFFFLQTIWTPEINALLLAFISGIMIYISYDELLPNTEKYGHHHLGVFGIVLGMAIMAISLLMT